MYKGVEFGIIQFNIPSFILSVNPYRGRSIIVVTARRLLFAAARSCLKSRREQYGSKLRCIPLWKRLPCFLPICRANQGMLCAAALHPPPHHRSASSNQSLQNLPQTSVRCPALPTSPLRCRHPLPPPTSCSPAFPLSWNLEFTFECIASEFVSHGSRVARLVPSGPPVGLFLLGSGRLPILPILTVLASLMRFHDYRPLVLKA